MVVRGTKHVALISNMDGASLKPWLGKKSVGENIESLTRQEWRLEYLNIHGFDCGNYHDDCKHMED